MDSGVLLAFALGSIVIAAISVIGNWKVAVALEQALVIQRTACAGCKPCEVRAKALLHAQERVAGRR